MNSAKPPRNVLALLAAGMLAVAAPAAAQPLGSFSWQMQPFCNRVTISVTQNGGIYTLDGYDDQCGAAERATLVGLATPNPDGTIGFGLNVVTPGGSPVHVDAKITLPSLGGTWRDSAGNTGLFVFGANTGGSPRPAAIVGDVTSIVTGAGLSGGGTSGEVSLSVDAAVIQQRVNGGCLSGQAVRTINQDGSVACESVAGGAGDITAVSAGSGLIGGGASGDVALAFDPAVVQARVAPQCPAGMAIQFISQNGAVTCGALGTGDITQVTVGPGMTGGGTSGPVSVSLVYSGDGTADAVARSDHEHSFNNSNVGIGLENLPATATGLFNTALGMRALRDNTSGHRNTGIGFAALQENAGGFQNTAVGADSMQNNLSGTQNVGIGQAALRTSTAGTNNVAVGAESLLTATGSSNVAVGKSAGTGLTTGSANTFVGQLSTAGANDLVNATAIGARAQVDGDDSLVLGSINGVNGATADTRVGIGTTTPDALLEVNSAGFVTAIFSVSSNQPTSYPRLQMRRSRGTRTAPTAVLANDVIGSIDATGSTGGGFTAGRAGISFRAAETWSSGGGTGTRIVFSTTLIGEPLTQTEQMVIDHDGQVAIGHTNPARKLDVNGNVRVGAIGPTSFWGCVEDRGGSMIAGTACSSDRRFKRDITPFAAALDHVAALRPVHFYWRADEFPERAFGTRESFGLIAQDVEAVLPELVTTDEDGYKAVNYSKLPLLAIQAITELKARNDALERRLAALEQRLNTAR